MTSRVLLVEDDASIALVITAALEGEGIKVERAGDLAARDAALAAQTFGVLVTDVILPDGDGIATLDRAFAVQPGLPTIILSAQNTLDTAVRASETGAFEYFPKPFDLDELTRAVRQALGSGAPMDEHEREDDGAAGLPLVGRSPAMQAVYRMITRVLRNDLTVLVLGESGTGKELVAEAIHRLGDRNAGPFIAVNAAAIPSELIESELFGHEKGAFTGAHARHIGKFEQAQGGTLFLDEIGDMPMQAQTRLLRALQSGVIRRVGGREEVSLNVRVIAATNKALEPLIAAGQFREDLYYRLNVVPILLPPLRERSDDVPALARHFLGLAASEGLPRRTLGNDGAELLARQYWRGNVRELRNFMFRLALLSREDAIDDEAVGALLVKNGTATGGDQPGQDRASGPASLDAAVEAWLAENDPSAGAIYEEALAAFERPVFAQVLARTGGNQLRAAHLLGINRNTLRKRLTELELNPDQFHAP